MRSCRVQRLNCRVQGLYRPAGTTYAVYEAIFKNGDSYAAGAFSEEDFQKDAEVWAKENGGIKSIEKMETEDAGSGYKITK